MSDMTSLSQHERLSRVTRYSLGILLLTSVHHAYGAYIYDSPWRLHVVGFAIGAAVLIGGAANVYRRHTGFARTLAFWVLCAVTLAFAIALIGFFEGGYNHVLKDALYFVGAPRDVMQKLFPAPAYEMPSSVFFEVTGVAQLMLGILGARHLYRLVSRGLGQQDRIDVPVAHVRQQSWR